LLIIYFFRCNLDSRYSKISLPQNGFYLAFYIRSAKVVRDNPIWHIFISRDKRKLTIKELCNWA